MLQSVLPASGVVLEIASGTGEHVVRFADALPDIVFQPSDPDAERRASIDAWSAGRANIRAAIDLDAVQLWPPMAVEAVVCINMIHIAPWSATEGLMRNAAAALGPGGVLILYGPFLRDGAHTGPGNVAFDADLRARVPRWGVRALEDVSSLAAAHGYLAAQIVAMPADNLSVVYRRGG